MLKEAKEGKPVNEKRRILLEDTTLFQPDAKLLSEAKAIKTGESFILKGLFQRAETENANRRIYRKELLEREVNKLNNLLQKGYSLTGELDHPECSEIRVQYASHKIIRLWMEGKDVYGELSPIVGDYSFGDRFVAQIKNNIRHGISSRGMGSLEEVSGKNYVSDDFELITFDMVSDPSTSGAFPKIIQEQMIKIIDKNMNESTNIADLMEKIRTELKIS